MTHLLRVSSLLCISLLLSLALSPISASGQANFAVSIDSTNSPIVEGDTLKVDATIENTGNQSDTQDVSLQAGGSEQDVTSLTLSDGESQTVSLAWATTVGVTVGDARYSSATVTSEDDSDRVSVSIEVFAPFVTVWNTENSGGTADDQIKIPGIGTDYTISWEEVADTSNSGDLTATNVVTVKFPEPGIYRVSIRGDFTRIHFGGDEGGDADKIIQVEQWGDIQWSTMEEAFTRPELFEGASNLELAANDTPDLANVTSLGRMFEGASSLTASKSSISEWDVSSVTKMFYMFRRADSFNADLSEWDVSNVTNMNTMFEGASSFNADLSAWDVSNVTDMRGMFSDADSFNADLGAWDVSNVTDMFSMFEGASSFNADLSSWDISKVANMSAMFNGSGLSVENYDRILIGWAGQDLQNDSDLGADGVQYCDGGPFRAHISDSFSWLFNDSGQQSTCPDVLRAFSANQLTSDGTLNFGDVGLAMTVSGLLGGDRVTTTRYNDAPQNAQGISKENVSQYRIIVAGGGVSFFDSTNVKFAVRKFVGIDQPGGVTIYKRSKPGHRTFKQLATSVDQNGTPENISDDSLSVTIANTGGEKGFGEFVFASDTNPLAPRAISVGTEMLDFETVAVKDTATGEVTISSDGDARLEGNIGLVGSNTPYFIMSGEGDFSLESGSDLDVNIGYAPEEVSNPDRDTLNINHNGDSTSSPIEIPIGGSSEDVIPPAIPSGLAVETKTDSVSVSWTQGTETDLTGYRLYRGVGEAPDTSETPLAEELLSETSYTDTSVAKGQVYRYGVTAVDTAGNESALSAEASAFLPPQAVEASVARSFGDASGPDDYRLVALPGRADTSLTQVLDGEAGAQWQAYLDDGSGGDFLVKYDGSDDFRFEAGRGFWVTSTEELTFEASVPAVKLQAGNAATIGVQEGWNLISNPLGKDVAWSEVRAATGTDLQPIWAFGGSFDTTATFASAAEGQAYYFFNDAEGPDSLVVPYPGVSGVGQSTPAQIASKQSDSEATTSKEPWALSLTASAGDRASEISVTLVEPEGTEEALIAPPGRFEPVSLRIQAQGNSSEDTSGRSGLLMADGRVAEGGGATFPLQLTSRAEGRVKLSAEGLREASIQEARLLHPSAGRTYDLGEKGTITISPEEGETVALKLAVGTKGYVEDEAENVLPDEVTLTSYPNPVRRQGTLEYALPEASEVTLKVYDVLGRQVATLAQGQEKAGRHTVRLETGRLSSGVYFGRLEAGGQTRTQKITVVR